MFQFFIPHFRLRCLNSIGMAHLHTRNIHLIFAYFKHKPPVSLEFTQKQCYISMKYNRRGHDEQLSGKINETANRHPSAGKLVTSQANKRKENSFMKTELTPDFIAEIRNIISNARNNAVRSVDFCRVQMYWNIGRRIIEEEQNGQARAEYGSYLIRNLAERLEPEYGSGFSVRILELSRQFYMVYPIANTLRSQLNWMQYRLLLRISDSAKREYYELEAVNHAWTGRELERQINSQLYERLLLSNDKEAVLYLPNPETLLDEMKNELAALEQTPPPEGGRQ